MFVEDLRTPPIEAKSTEAPKAKAPSMAPARKQDTVPRESRTYKFVDPLWKHDALAKSLVYQAKDQLPAFDRSASFLSVRFSTPRGVALHRSRTGHFVGFPPNALSISLVPKAWASQYDMDPWKTSFLQTGDLPLPC